MASATTRTGGRPIRPTSPPTVILIDNGRESGDFGYKTGIRDLNNVAPRVGFAYNVGGKSDLVIRGGAGLYYNTPVSNVTYSHQYFNRSVSASINPNGPGFMENPTRGVTADDYLSGRVFVTQAPRIIASDYVDPYSWQSSIGFQKQLGPAMGFDVDLTALEEKNQARSRDPNLFYDPVTGYNLDPNKFGRPNPSYAPDPVDGEHAARRRPCCSRARSPAGSRTISRVA